MRYTKRVTTYSSTLAIIAEPGCPFKAMQLPEPANSIDRPRLHELQGMTMRCTTLAAHRPKVPLMKLLQVSRLWALWRGKSAKKLQSTLSSILTCVVDILSIVPKASMDSLGADGNGA